ncbi:MAG: Clp1/GlmU family protein, partial [Armatimonadota bacterium]
MAEPVVPDAWLDLLEGLAGERGAVMVVGGVDTGKTVLSGWLAKQLAGRGPAALVDSDLGQSVLGPPGTVGWGMADAGTAEFLFVGEVSPARRLLGTATATWRACERARAAGAAWLVLDTCGYVDGLGAVALKRAKMDLVRPTDVVLLEDSPDRLAAVARAIRPAEARVHYLRPAAAVEARGPARRRQWREQRFRECLAGARVRPISLVGRAVYGGRPWRWAAAWPRLE